MTVTSCKVTQSVGYRDTCVLEAIAPAEDSVFREGKNLVIAFLDGIIFSGVITRSTATKMSPDSAATQVYKYEVEAESDMRRFENMYPPSANLGSKTEMTAGEVVEEILPTDNQGEINITDGGDFDYEVVALDIASQLDDIASQTGYDWRTRRDYDIYTTTDYDSGTCEIEFSESGVISGDYIGYYLYFIDGDGAYRSGGEISTNTSTDGSGLVVVTVSNLTNVSLPVIGDKILIAKEPVYDFAADLGASGHVAEYTVNTNLFDYSANDDTDNYCTCVIVSGKNDAGVKILSHLSAVHNITDGVFDDCTYTTYRSDSIMYTEDYTHANTTDGLTFYVYGHNFKGLDNETIWLGADNSLRNPFTINGTPVETTLNDGTKVTEITVDYDSDRNLEVYGSGTPVCHERIYVTDNSGFSDSDDIWVGDEMMTLLSSSGTGTESNGGNTYDWIAAGVNRGLQDDELSYDHPAGVLVRLHAPLGAQVEPSDPVDDPATYAESGSPVGKYGTIIKTITPTTGSSSYSRGDLDRVATTYLLTACQIYEANYKEMPNASGWIPLRDFWKVSGGYNVPIQAGDTIRVNNTGETDDLQVVKCIYYLKKKKVEVELGSLNTSLQSQLESISSTISSSIY